MNIIIKPCPFLLTCVPNDTFMAHTHTHSEGDPHSCLLCSQGSTPRLYLLSSGSVEGLQEAPTGPIGCEHTAFLPTRGVGLSQNHDPTCRGRERKTESDWSRKGGKGSLGDSSLVLVLSLPSLYASFQPKDTPLFCPLPENSM